MPNNLADWLEHLEARIPEPASLLFAMGDAEGRLLSEWSAEELASVLAQLDRHELETFGDGKTAVTRFRRTETSA